MPVILAKRRKEQRTVGMRRSAEGDVKQGTVGESVNLRPKEGKSMWKSRVGRSASRGIYNGQGGELNTRE